MTSIPTGASGALMNLASFRSLLGDVKPVDLKNVSTVSAASDFAFNVADADKDASLSIDEFAALGKKNPADTNARSLFAAMDGDNDGKLNSREVRASGLLSPGNIQALLGIDDVGGWMVSQADADGDGGLTYEEYTESRNAGPILATVVGPDGAKTEIKGMRLDTLPTAFNGMDDDGDGRLSAAELNAYLEAPEGYAQYNPTSGAARSSEQLVSYNDANGDGALSVDELRQATEAPAYPGKDGDAEDAGTLVDVADTNKDRKVSSDEFSALAEQGRLSPFFARNDSEAVSRVLLTRLLQSTFTQLRGDFLTPPPLADIKA